MFSTPGSLLDGVAREAASGAGKTRCSEMGVASLADRVVPAVSAPLSSALRSGSDAEQENDTAAGRSSAGVRSAAGLDAVYRSHAGRLVRGLARWGSREDAGDAVQEAFAKMAAMLGASGSNLASPEAYVTTVATNVLRDRARTVAREALRDRELALDAPSEASDPHNLMESREALRAIERALASMNARRARIFALHRFEQMTYAQIAGEVGMSEKGVKKQIAKALVELRDAVGRSSC
jgi:RNA polymerase sigma-70 factor (ECF subfamily)